MGHLFRTFLLCRPDGSKILEWNQDCPPTINVHTGACSLDELDELAEAIVQIKQIVKVESLPS